MDKRYIVCDWPVGDGDCFSEVFMTLEEANRDARHKWDHLTRREKERWHIFVAVVMEDQLDPDDVEEYGEGAWEMVSDFDVPEGAFDSDLERGNLCEN